MNNVVGAVLALMLGMCVLIWPQYFRYYTFSELLEGIKPMGKLEKYLTGGTFILIGLLILYLEYR